MPETEAPININLETPKTQKLEIYDYLVLDCSGSMGIVKNTLITQVNDYIDALQKVAKETGVKTYFSLIKFGSEVTTVFEFMDVGEARPLTSEDYRTDGMTALNDAVGAAIDSLRNKLSGRESSDDIDVTITIFTDGYENCSQRYPGAGNSELKTLISEIEGTFKWTITYVGGGSEEEVASAATHMGINYSNVMAYAADDDGVRMSSNAMRLSRSAKTSAFSMGIKSNVGYFSDSVTQIPASDLPPRTVTFPGAITGEGVFTVHQDTALSTLGNTGAVVPVNPVIDPQTLDSTTVTAVVDNTTIPTDSE